MRTIVISQEYSETLGARHIEEGDYSGEDFRENFLLPKFLEALENGEQITINLDGGYGNPVSFIEEAFGGLARKYGTDSVMKVLRFVCNDEPTRVEEIISYIENPFTNQVYQDSQKKENGNGDRSSSNK